MKITITIESHEPIEIAKARAVLDAVQRLPGRHVLRAGYEEYHPNGVPLPSEVTYAGSRPAKENAQEPPKDTPEQVTLPHVPNGATPKAKKNPPPPLVDSTGRVWNEKIHAASRSKVAGDKWRKKRGVDQITVDEVHAAEDAANAAKEAAGGTPPPPPEEAVPPPPPAPEDDAPAPPAPEDDAPAPPPPEDDDPFAEDEEPTSWDAVVAAYKHMNTASELSSQETRAIVQELFTKAGIDASKLKADPAQRAQAIEVIFARWPPHQM